MTYSATVVGKTPIGVGETELRIYRAMGLLGSVQFKMVSMCSEKPICAIPSLSEVPVSV